MKSVGVAIPIYNEERFITKTLSAFLKQDVDYKKFFIVLADNGSTDKTIDKVVTFRKKHPQLSLTIVAETKRGKRFARKKALDVASKMGAFYLLSTDADSVVPCDIISTTTQVLKRSQFHILRGKIFFPAKTLLLKIIYMKKIRLLVAKLRCFEQSFFGPAVSGAFFAVPAKLYNQVYYGDIDNPLITQEDHLLSRRLYYMGGVFVDSSNHVITSDRRFWGDVNLYARGVRIPDFRNVQRKISLRKFSQQEVDEITHFRITDTAQRLIRQLVDAMFFWHITGCKYEKARNTYIKVLQFACMSEDFSQPIKQEERFSYFNNLKKKYLTQIEEKILEYINSQ